MTYEEYRKQLLQKYGMVELLPDPDQEGNIDDENVALLAEAYRTGADIPPIVAQRLRNGDLQIVEGHHRYEAARLAGVRPDVVVKSSSWVRKQQREGSFHLDIEYDAQVRFERYAELMYKKAC